MKRALVPLMLVLALTTGSAEACVPTTSTPLLTFHAYGGVGLYVAQDEGWLTCEWGIPECGSVWIYQESNGIAGLQRDDEMRDDTCGGQIPSDTILA